MLIIFYISAKSGGAMVPLVPLAPLSPVSLAAWQNTFQTIDNVNRGAIAQGYSFENYRLVTDVISISSQFYSNFMSIWSRFDPSLSRFNASFIPILSWLSNETLLSGCHPTDEIFVKKSFCAMHNYH
jgi:hypothetical protein